MKQVWITTYLALLRQRRRPEERSPETTAWRRVGWIVMIKTTWNIQSSTIYILNRPQVAAKYVQTVAWKFRQWHWDFMKSLLWVITWSKVAWFAQSPSRTSKKQTERIWKVGGTNMGLVTTWHENRVWLNVMSLPDCQFTRTNMLKHYNVASYLWICQRCVPWCLHVFVLMGNTRFYKFMGNLPVNCPKLLGPFQNRFTVFFRCAYVRYVILHHFRFKELRFSEHFNAVEST